MTRGRRYLFILMGALGDVVRGMYLIDALKNAEPDAHITWLVEPGCAGIVKLHPRIDEIVVFDRPRGLVGIFRLWKELHRRTFDIVLDLQRHAKSGLFSWFSRAPRRIGFHRRDAKEFNWIFNTEFVPPQGESIAKIEHYMTFLESVGVPTTSDRSSGLQDITLETVTGAWVAQLQQPYVVCVLGSSWDSKDWPFEGYAGLLQELPECVVVLLSDKTKIEMAARLELVETKAKVVNLAGKTSLKDVVAILRCARVCVGPDSGPGHIAGAVGTPHITLFGPTPAVRNSPRGSESLVLSSRVGCSPCKRRTCPGLDKVCMRLIPPQQVVDYARRFLG